MSPPRRPARRRPKGWLWGRPKPQPVLRLGEPVAQDLGGPIAELELATQALASVAARMTLPLADEGAVQRFSGGAFAGAGQLELAALIQQALRKEKAVVDGSGVRPQVLGALRKKHDIVVRARRTAAQAQGLAAGGRLLLGARFGLFFSRLMAVYERRLGDETQPLEGRLRLAADFARVDALRFRMLSRAPGRPAEAAMGASSAHDEAAFLEVRRLLEAGERPELQLLQQALRHARRMQEGAEPPAPVDSERRRAPRD